MTTRHPTLLLIALLATACASEPTATPTPEPHAAAAGTEAAADELAVRDEITALDAPLYGGLAEIRVEVGAAGKTRPVSLEEGAELPGDEPIGTESLVGRNLVLVVGRTKLAGEVISDDGHTLELQFTTATGVRGVNKIRYRDLAPRTQLQLMAARSRADDANAHLRLGVLAAANGLHDEALHHYLRAGSIDRSLTEQVETALETLRSSLADARLADARRLLADGHVGDAQIRFSGIARDFTGTAAAEHAQRELADLGPRVAQARERERRKADARIRKLLAPASDLLDTSLERSFQGLEAGGNTGQAVSRLKSAHTKATQARRRVENLLERHHADAGVVDAATDLAAEIDGQLRDVQNHLASVYLVRRDYTRALAAANLALQIDPDDERAADLRQRIEDAIAARDKAYYENRYRHRYGYPAWVHGGWYGGWVRPGWRGHGGRWGHRGGSRSLPSGRGFRSGGSMRR